jgi:hypothetical protein
MFMPDETAFFAGRVENAFATAVPQARLNDLIARIIIVESLWPFTGQRARE